MLIFKVYNVSILTEVQVPRLFPLSYLNIMDSYLQMNKSIFYIDLPILADFIAAIFTRITSGSVERCWCWWIGIVWITCSSQRSWRVNALQYSLSFFSFFYRWKNRITRTRHPHSGIVLSSFLFHYTLFYRQLGCLAFSLGFWPKIKQLLSLPSLRLDFFFQNRWFFYNRVKINYKTKQPLRNFLARFPKFC